ncbi:CheR family methyltransferase [Desulfovibrio oxyclinae]|jgi:chemotaxis protein methyltransferase CheR|uniref:CheR family methyltransferase n=1 Tax=Desulfovibrio oxyclinae TaxID=63560 RepID=UPI00035EA282|nr:protein-glutamate O-methyltransferase CheR [Desulfovibrio oxyclinae]
MSLFSSSIGLRKDSIRITDAEFVELRDFIYEKSGIFVDEKRKYLFESRFRKRLGELGLSSFSDYIKFLKFDSARREEMVRLFEMVTTNETSFFRDQKQLDAFRDHVLKDVIDQQRAAKKMELNIWSAGCSSGEEPYTLSIILHEMLGLEISRWRIRISANDLSKAMIDKAREGLYPEYAFKTTPDAMRKKYFKQDGDLWRINRDVTRMVDFKLMNLNESATLKRIPRSHIVFCRNVIIYFDESMKKRVVNSFYDNLVPGGYLMLGHSESLHKVSKTFKPIFHPGAIAYKKE